MIGCWLIRCLRFVDGVEILHVVQRVEELVEIRL